MTNVATLKKSARIRVLNDNFRSTFLGGQVAAPSFCAPADDAPADVCPARNRAQESLRPSGGIQSEKHSQMLVDVANIRCAGATSSIDEGDDLLDGRTACGDRTDRVHHRFPQSQPAMRQQQQMSPLHRTGDCRRIGPVYLIVGNFAVRMVAERTGSQPMHTSLARASSPAVAINRDI
jgi:hypothetical protein